MNYENKIEHEGSAKKSLTLAVAVIISLGILPSFTALSGFLFTKFPFFSRYSGPVNLLKLGFPLVLLFLALNWRRFSKKEVLFGAAILAIGSISTLIAASRCGYQADVIREWAVMSTGVLSAIALWLLPSTYFRAVIISWAVIIYGSIFFDLAAPQVIDWLYSNIFDPSTRYFDYLELKERALTGVFGRQSLAKFLSWFPWIFALIFVSDKAASRKILLLPIALGLISFALIMRTSQRGPMIAAIAGCMAFFAYLFVQLRLKKALIIGVASLVVIVATSAIIVPPSIYIPRIKSLLGKSPDTTGNIYTPETVAEHNRRVRIKLFNFAVSSISSNPLGNACAPIEDYIRVGLQIKSHSHSLFLEQFRTRGWLWGLIHLSLWLYALVSAWRLRSLAGALWMGGLISVVVGGLFDHPWFVLNQAILLGVFLTKRSGPPFCHAARHNNARHL